jgi:glycosyltransferase involved in cell wall biosynthesis
MNVSIVIPVYNEAAHLGACLEAIAAQTVRPLQVIVVDNNSSDDSVAVAQRFDFVQLLHEPKQGVTHARTRGFNAARGDIIGRIDADSLLPTDWVATVQTIFADPTIDAVSGSVSYHDMPFRRLVDRIDLFFRQRIADGMGDEVFLYGANMAMRRSTWQQSRSQLCNVGGLHEDFDLAIHAEEAGARVVFDRRLHAVVSLRRLNTSLRAFWNYAWLNPKTYARHGRTSQRHMYPAIVLLIVFYWLIKMLYGLYDPQTESLSWHNLLLPVAPVRVNPATFVD